MSGTVMLEMDRKKKEWNTARDKDIKTVSSSVLENPQLLSK